MADAESILTARAVELEAIDNTVIGEVVGVSQSIGDLRKALDVLEGLLGERQFEKAAALGYQERVFRIPCHGVSLDVQDIV